MSQQRRLPAESRRRRIHRETHSPTQIFCFSPAGMKDETNSEGGGPPRRCPAKSRRPALMPRTRTLEMLIDSFVIGT